MMKPIKPTVFQVTPQDTAIAKDVYTDSVSDTINDIVGENPILNKAVDFVKNSDIIKPDKLIDIARESLKTEDGRFTFDFSEAGKRAGNAMLSGTPFSFSGSVKDSIAKNIKDSGLLDTLLDSTDAIGEATGVWLDKGIVSDIKILKDGVVKFIKADASDVSSIFDLVGQITGVEGIFKYVDIGAQVGMVKTVLDFANRWGIPDLGDLLLDKFEDVSIANSLIEEYAIKAARSGDIRSVATWVKKMGSGRTGAISDQLILYIVKYFKDPEEFNGYTALGDELLALLASIDVKWNLDKTTSSTSLYYYAEANAACKHVLTFTSHRAYAVAGKTKFSPSPASIIAKTFPKLN